MLPNDWPLYYHIKKNPKELTYDFVWIKILRFYELLFPFMGNHVFKFSEPAKVRFVVVGKKKSDKLMVYGAGSSVW